MSNIFSFLTYLIGGFIMYRLGFIWFALYILYILILEIRLLKKHCVDCYYYGKTCCFGKGRLSRLFFKKGDTTKFNQNKMTWKNLVPDFLVSVAPLFVGIFMVITRFNWLIMFSIISLFILAFVGNALVRSQLACKYCRQCEFGCPAQKLFDKTK